MIILDDYIARCRQLLAEDPTLTEVYALDVIGDHEGSLRNCEAMWSAGVPAIPCYHYGEPEHILLAMAQQYPKIALGGAVGLRSTVKLRWAQQCFARVWPKRIHGFGFGSEKHILALPWHSVDSDPLGDPDPCGSGRSTYGDRNEGELQNPPRQSSIPRGGTQSARWAKEMILRIHRLPRCACGRSGARDSQIYASNRLNLSLHLDSP